MKKSESDLNSEALFKRMEHTILWSVDQDGLLIKSFSPNADQILGLIPKKNILDYIHSVDHEEVNKCFGRVKEVHQVVMQHRFFRPSGQSVWFQTELSYRPESQEIIGVSQDISEVKTGFTSVAVDEEGDKLRGIFQFSTDLICIAGVDGTFKEINPAFEKTLGYTEQELLSRKFLELIHPDDLEITKKALKAMDEGHPIKDFENRYRKKDGTYIWLSWMGHPIPGTNLVYSIARDISEKKKAVKELEKLVKETSSELVKSREFLNLVIENVPHMMFVKDAKELRFVHFNKAGEDLLGYSKNDLLGKNDYDFFPKEQADFFTNKDKEVLTGKKLVQITEEEISTKHGKKYLRTKKVPLLNEEGEPIYLLGFSEDITDWKTAADLRLEMAREQTLSKEKERAQQKATFLASVSSVLASSLDFRDTLEKLAQTIVPFLGDWCSILFIKEEGTIERIAIHHWDLKKQHLIEKLSHYPGSRTILNSPTFQQTLKTGKSYFFNDVTDKELNRLALDEEHLKILRELGTHSAMAIPIIYGDKIYGAISLNLADKDRTYDQETLLISEEVGRKAGVAIENALLYRTAQKAIAARDEFLSIASHELKTPVTSIKLLLQMTRKSVNPATGAGPSAEKLAHVLDQANDQVNRLTTLIEDLLDVSRIEMGKIFYKFLPLDFSHLLKEVCSRYREHMKSFHCELTCSIEDGLTILGDRMRIEQVIINLLTNAAKYGEQKPVTVTLKKMSNSVVLEIKDQGMGIPQDKLSKVFDRFERAVQASNISGLGLGLYISREIVEAHLGNISVVSEVNRGSTFRVEIPIYLGNAST
ncbi:PAS domain S-box protein [Peredibacter starrii]|uniref:histidine kinase n=1 Tax=Peredibacter starrii TaxID=28202 RepID=A0AAX4HU57_9BACT|nr:PAS domain S-box protein [Peredibacter starrii]WPU66913.1 PAS domain S-box protein [Peredibacter starrii]